MTLLLMALQGAGVTLRATSKASTVRLFLFYGQSVIAV